MTEDPEPDQPLRWARDGADEDAEAHRAAEQDKLDAWALEQPSKRLSDAMEAAGLIRERREGGQSRIVVPEWWTQIEAPAACCPRCQRPAAGDGLCGGCLDAQARDPDPDSLLAHWAALPPPGRRFHLGAEHGIDPWTGQPCRIEVETTVTDLEAGVGVTRSRLHSIVPRTSWNLPREG